MSPSLYPTAGNGYFTVDAHGLITDAHSGGAYAQISINGGTALTQEALLDFSAAFTGADHSSPFYTHIGLNGAPSISYKWSINASASSGGGILDNSQQVIVPGDSGPITTTAGQMTQAAGNTVPQAVVSAWATSTMRDHRSLEPRHRSRVSHQDGRDPRRQRHRPSRIRPGPDAGRLRRPRSRQPFMPRSNPCSRKHPPSRPTSSDNAWCRMEGIVAVMRPTIYDAAAIAAAIQAQKDAQEDAQAIEGAFSRFFHRLWKAV